MRINPFSPRGSSISKDNASNDKLAFTAYERNSESSLTREMAALAKKGVKCSAVQEERCGSITKMRLPGGGEVGLYQPKHPTALRLGSK